MLKFPHEISILFGLDPANQPILITFAAHIQIRTEGLSSHIRQPHLPGVELVRSIHLTKLINILLCSRSLIFEILLNVRSLLKTGLQLSLIMLEIDAVTELLIVRSHHLVPLIVRKLDRV